MEDSDEETIEYAKQKVSEGTGYIGIGYVDLDLVLVVKVDPNNEWEETETIWH